MFACLCFSIYANGEAFAGQPLPPPGVAERESHREQEQERQRRQEMEDAQPDVRLETGEIPAANLEYPTDEKPCFLIREIRIEGDSAEKFQWALRAVDDVIGRCLGGKGINIAMARVQDAILKKGYTTTRIVAAPQDLKTGILTFKVIPGIVSDVVLSEKSGKHIELYPMIPIRKGRILNIRDMEQGVENLRRIPTVQTDMKLVPGEKEGESKVEVTRTQGRPVRVMLSADDSGSKYTGKYQGTATLSIDNMLGLSDMFYASVGSDLEHSTPYGTNNYSFYYSIPWTYWQLTFNHNNYDYHQTVAGSYVDYVYSGENQNTNLELSRIIYRTAKSKTSLSGAGYLNASRNYIDDTEMEIQRRRMAGWEIGFNHRQFIGPATFDTDLRYKHGTGMLNAMPAPEEAVDEGASRPQILTMNLRLNLPFKLWKQDFRFHSAWRQQWAFNKLVQRDRISIGGRYTVRGYDGEMTLSADNGYFSRNEVSWVIPKIKQELYAAFDIGRVYGPKDEFLLGKTLSGAALGLRGGHKMFSYDVFVSRPVNKPYKFPGSRYVYGFSTSVQF